jgi:hypothetical protein
MAKVTLNGIVSSVAKERIVNLWETFDVNGKQVFRKWTIWAEMPWGVEKGDWVEVEGELSSKIGSYERNGETKETVEHSLNSPRLLQHKPDTEMRTKLGFMSNAEKLAANNPDEAPF